MTAESDPTNQPDSPPEFPGAAAIRARRAELERDIAEAARQAEEAAALDPYRFDQWWYILSENEYMYVPTGRLHVAAAVDKLLPRVDGLPASTWLVQNRICAGMGWEPAEREIILDRVPRENEWVHVPGTRTFNTYRPPYHQPGDPDDVTLWRNHLREVYGEADATHIERWMAQRVQHPHIKVNHALVLGGPEGIGKDTILEPVIVGVGLNNTNEISPKTVLGGFNWFVRCTLLRISEARDLGDRDKYHFHEQCKTLVAAPPAYHTCNEKYVRPYPVANVCGVVITTNYKHEGLYWPINSRRYYLAWTDVEADHFSSDYFAVIWDWYRNGGIWNVIEWLKQLDLSQWDPNAPPPKTDAFIAVAVAAAAGGEGTGGNTTGDDAAAELTGALLDLLSNPEYLTTQQLRQAAIRLETEAFGPIAEWASDYLKTPGRWNKKIARALDRAGYTIVMGPIMINGITAKARPDARWNGYVGKKQVQRSIYRLKDDTCDWFRLAQWMADQGINPWGLQPTDLIRPVED